MSAEGDALGESFQCGSLGNAFHLAPINAAMGIFGIEKARVESRFVTEEEETLGVGIQPTQGVYIFWESKFGQGPVGGAIRSELGEDPVGFMEGKEHRI